MDLEIVRVRIGAEEVKRPWGKKMAKTQPKVTPMAMAIAILVFRTDCEVFRCISLRPVIFCLIWFDGSVFVSAFANWQRLLGLEKWWDRQRLRDGCVWDFGNWGSEIGGWLGGWSCIQSSVVVELCSKGQGERCQNRRREKDN